MGGEWNESFIHEDIALKIVSFLQVAEVCSLGSCSRFWRRICGSDCVWVSLCKDRWPSLKISKQSSVPVVIRSNESTSHEQQFSSLSVMGWRNFYIEQHNDMGTRAATVAKFVEESISSESLEGTHFRHAIDKLVLTKMGLKDVARFLLTSKQNVFINLVGLHYCLFLLEPEPVVQALWNHHISERQVCVKWWEMQRFFYGHRIYDDYSKKVSLGDLAFFKEKEVQGILFQGASPEVFRVQISVPDPV